MIPCGKSSAAGALVALVMLAAGAPPGWCAHHSHPPIGISAAAPGPILGIDDGADIQITLPPALHDIETASLNLGTSAGHLDKPIRRDPATLQARLHLPTTRYPQVIVVWATAGPDIQRPHRGVLVLPVRAVANPGFKTSPQAEVTLQIGDNIFGPQKADDQGNVHVPVVVAPGQTHAAARSANRHGKSTLELIDLQLPALNQIIVAGPRTIPRGQSAELLTVALDQHGNALPGRAVAVWSPDNQRASLLHDGADHGVFLIDNHQGVSGLPSQWRIETLPLKGATPTKTTWKFTTIPALAETLKVIVPTSPLILGTRDTATVAVQLLDTDGGPGRDSDLRVYADGVPLQVAPHKGHTATAEISAPAEPTGRTHILIEAVTPRAYGRNWLPLGGFARKAPAPVFDRATHLAVSGGLIWTGQQGIGPAIRVSLQHRPGGDVWPAGLTVGATTALLASQPFAGDATGLTRTTLVQCPLMASAQWRVRLRRLVEVRLGVAAGANLVWARLDDGSFVTSGLGIGPAVQSHGEIAITHGTGQWIVGASYLWSGDVTINRNDRLNGNIAGLLTSVGYRWGL